MQFSSLVLLSIYVVMNGIEVSAVPLPAPQIYPVAPIYPPRPYVAAGPYGPGYGYGPGLAPGYGRPIYARKENSTLATSMSNGMMTPSTMTGEHPIMSHNTTMAHHNMTMVHPTSGSMIGIENVPRPATELTMSLSTMPPTNGYIRNPNARRQITPIANTNYSMMPPAQTTSIMANHPPTMNGQTPVNGQTPATTTMSNQMNTMAPSTPMTNMNPPNHMAKMPPSNLMMNPSNQMATPLNPMMTSSSQMTAPSNQLTPPSNQLPTPSYQMMNPSNTVVVPSTNNKPEIDRRQYNPSGTMINQTAPLAQPVPAAAAKYPTSGNTPPTNMATGANAPDANPSSSTMHVYGTGNPTNNVMQPATPFIVVQYIPSSNPPYQSNNPMTPTSTTSSPAPLTSTPTGYNTPQSYPVVARPHPPMQPVNPPSAQTSPSTSMQPANPTTS